jgi:hypothetical protein
MNENGKTIIDLIKEVRQLSEDLHLLLSTADGLMKEKGWEPFKNKSIKTAMTEHSPSLDIPEEWYPYYLFRFYRKDKSNFLLFISVLLYNDNEGHYEITEPLITAGYFDYGQEKVTFNTFEYWYAKWFGYLKEKADGIIHSSDDNWKDKWKTFSNEDSRINYPFIKWMCFGLPLTNITNSDELKSKIIKPLIDKLPIK